MCKPLRRNVSKNLSAQVEMSMPDDGVCVAGRECQITQTNRALVELHGYTSKDEIVEKHVINLLLEEGGSNQ